MEDRASSGDIGLNGWGTSDLTLDKIYTEEKKMFDVVAMNNPGLILPRAAREPNLDKILQVQKVMRDNGMEEGFWFGALEIAVFGSSLEWIEQLIGSCVASGGMRACASRMLAEVFLLNDPESLFGTSLIGPNNLAHFAPYSYRNGRKRAGLNGNGDGSYCSVHCEGLAEDGQLLCSTPGLGEYSDTFPEPQSASTYRKWGANDTLVNRFLAEGRKYKLLESPKIDSPDQAKDLLLAFKPFMVCSGWAFKPDYVHPTWKLADGSPVVIYKRDTSTSWAHNMTIWGWVRVGNRWYVVVLNSWPKNSHKNGRFFVIPIELYGEWVSRSEQQAIGEIDMADNSSPILAV